MKYSKIMSIAITLLLSMGIASVANAQLPSKEKKADGSAGDGITPHAVTVKDVPVDAFWSITVYNADGYLETNDLGVNSYNNFSAKPNKDGSYTIHFGGDPKSVNYLPITEGWNYAVRMYQPRKEILDGTWTFPSVEPVK
jgi:hypothetical protein